MTILTKGGSMGRTQCGCIDRGRMVALFRAVVAAAIGYAMGCGSATSTGDNTFSSTTVSLTGTVEAPSASANIAVAPSTSKGVGGSVLKSATTDTLVTGGTIACKLLDGTKLDEGTINADGTFANLAIDPTLLDATKQVLVETQTSDKETFTTLCDLTTGTAGTTIDCGKTNADTTLAVQQIYYQADTGASPDNPTAIAAKILSGEIRPLALFKTFKGVFDVTSTPGTDDAAGAYQAIRLAFRAALTTGTPHKYAEINKALRAGGLPEA